MAEGTGEGNAGETGARTGQQGSPAWLAQLPADLKANEVFTKYPTLGDLGKSHLDVLGKIKDLDGITAKSKDLEAKLSNSIPKLSGNPTQDELAAFNKALGVPDKPTDYEFPKSEGIEHDPKMVEWAQKTFHAAHLSKEQAGVISTAWDGFLQGMVKAEEEADVKDRQTAEANLKKELGDKYDAAVELTRRLLKESATPEELAFLDESKLGNHPAMIRLIVKFAQKTGEDSTLKGQGPKGETPTVGIKYNMPKFA